MAKKSFASYISSINNLKKRSKVAELISRIRLRRYIKNINKALTYNARAPKTIRRSRGAGAGDLLSIDSYIIVILRAFALRMALIVALYNLRAGWH